MALLYKHMDIWPYIFGNGIVSVHLQLLYTSTSISKDLLQG